MTKSQLFSLLQSNKILPFGIWSLGHPGLSLRFPTSSIPLSVILQAVIVESLYHERCDALPRVSSPTMNPDRTPRLQYLVNQSYPWTWDSQSTPDFSIAFVHHSAYTSGSVSLLITITNAYNLHALIHSDLRSSDIQTVRIHYAAPTIKRSAYIILPRHPAY